LHKKKARSFEEKYINNKYIGKEMGTLHTLQDNIRNCSCSGNCKNRCSCNRRKKTTENVNIINIGNKPYRQHNETSVIPPVVIPPSSNYSTVENNNDYHDIINEEQQSYFPTSRIFERSENIRPEPPPEPPPKRPILMRSKPLPNILPIQEELNKLEIPEYLLIFHDRNIYPEFY